MIYTINKHLLLEATHSSNPKLNKNFKKNIPVEDLSKQDKREINSITRNRNEKAKQLRIVNASAKNPNDKYNEISKGTIKTYKKTELHENSADFQALMRNQSISGNTMSPEDMHKQSLMKDGKDVYSEVLNAEHKITNNALNVDYLKERQWALARKAKGI